MKNIRFLGIALLVVFLSMPTLDALAACESLQTSLDTATQDRDKAKETLEGLTTKSDDSLIINIGKSIAGKRDIEDVVRDGVDNSVHQSKVKAAREALKAAEKAYSEAYMDYMICYTSHLLEEITGPCGHTYKRLHRSDHAEVTGMCGHTYYQCQSGGHGYISSSKCSKCNSYYFTCQMSCPAGGVHH